MTARKQQQTNFTAETRRRGEQRKSEKINQLFIRCTKSFRVKVEELQGTVLCGFYQKLSSRRCPARVSMIWMARQPLGLRFLKLCEGRVSAVNKCFFFSLFNPALSGVS
jgi:hypothetical protein